MGSPVANVPFSKFGAGTLASRTRTRLANAVARSLVDIA